MAAQIIVELPSKQKVLIGGGGSGPGGLGEAGLGEAVAKGRTIATDAFKAALGGLPEIASLLAAAVQKMPQRPDTFEVSFRASLTSKADLWIVAGDAEAEFTVTLSWGKDG